MTVEEMKEIKKENGYTYEQISEMSGVPLGTVQKIFSGETQAPRYATLQALEAVFKKHQVAYSFDHGIMSCVQDASAYKVWIFFNHIPICPYIAWAITHSVTIFA